MLRCVIAKEKPQLKGFIIIRNKSQSSNWNFPPSSAYCVLIKVVFRCLSDIPNFIFFIFIISCSTNRFICSYLFYVHNLIYPPTSNIENNKDKSINTNPIAPDKPLALPQIIVINNKKLKKYIMGVFSVIFSSCLDS